MDEFRSYSFQDDYIGTMFFFLSGYWKHTHPEFLDDLGRFPGKNSFQNLLGLLEEPIVDILVERIKQKFNLTYKRKSPWIFVTHDIDFLVSKWDFLKNCAGDIVKRRKILHGIKRLLGFENKKSIEYLVKLHKRMGTRGTFFFLPKEQYGIFQAGYKFGQA